MLKKHNIEIIGEGITTGVTALMMLELKKTNIEAVSIMADVNTQADYEAAARLLAKVKEMTGIELDTDPLMKEAKETEKALLKQLSEMKKVSEKAQKIESRTPMYT